ncbi:hypothetical protein J437_LFUL005531 [Ladona fulva]|uniref:RNA-directed DNA polymerase n=1 Tax=Ladona fulva TaxID=123851 RepID=A0A8K0P0J4_LADFU|nr:hypothetical protein J437_LFUL005531 [Ladona fulva]
MALQENYLKIIHQKGKVDVVADMLSWNSTTRAESTKVPGELIVSVLVGERPKVSDINVQQCSNKTLLGILEGLEDAGEPCLERESDNFQLVNGMLYRRNSGRGLRLLLVVPYSLHSDVLEACHAGATGVHLGMTKTRDLIQGSYWWPQLVRDVHGLVRTCALSIP